MVDSVIKKRLWYRQPAKRWEEALPLGNGRIGAMAHGFAGYEYFQLNEDSCWCGGFRDRNNPDALKALPIIRQMLFEGRIAEAESLIMKSMSGIPRSQYPYQTLGDFKLYMGHGDNCSDYLRELDIENAIYRCSYVSDGVAYCREAFISAVDNCLVCRISADKPGMVNVNTELYREPFDTATVKTGEAKDWVLSSDEQKECGIMCYGNTGCNGVDFAFELRALTKGGRVSIIGENLEVTAADEAVFIVAAATSFREKEPAKANAKVFEKAFEYSYDELKKRHIEDYRSFFDRVELCLTAKDNEAEDIPTDIRLKELSPEKPDRILDELYFNFGRYLLISGSRPGSLPLNLQGIWCHDYTPAWCSKYTININLQMNYWPVEICNLSELHEPLFEHIKRMQPNGRVTAEKMYGCKGWTAHHNTDLWGDTAVQDHWIPGSYWVMGAAWLCTHQWMHYLYTKDLEFLKESFPIMRDAAEFFLDFLIEYKGYLVTSPSVSPENTYLLPNGEHGAITFGATMDNQIIRDLFGQCIAAAEILNIDDELNERIKAALAKIAPDRIGKHGQIMEWIEDYDEMEPGHRHISHLYGLHPSAQITPDKTPELAEAAKITLKRRLENGGGHTGWSRAWIINNYAKLFDGEKAYENVCQLLKSSTLPNLFDNHPPFQIDGNFGGIAGMAHMLLQSSEERSVLLPALPKAWSCGHVKGLKLMGDAEIEMSWTDGELDWFIIKSNKAFDAVILYKGVETGFSLPAAYTTGKITKNELIQGLY